MAITHSNSSFRSVRAPVWIAMALVAVVCLPAAAQQASLELAQASVPAPATQSLPVAPAPAASAASFRLQNVRFVGADAIDAVALRALAQPYIGRDVRLGDLEQLAQAVTDRYRAQGFFLAQAVVPVQSVQGGVVEISVIEGRLGKVTIEIAPDAPTSDERVRAFLAAMAPGQAVSARTYERAMLLLSDQPGLKVSSALQEGIEPGTTDLSVEVSAAPRVSFAAELDNHGTKESGRYRVGGTVRWMSPLGIGDNLDARLMVSNGNALQFGRVSYEAPIGGSGLRAGIGISRINYELGGDFSDLEAHGTADIIDASLNYPLIRQRQHNLFLRLSADSKRLKDDLDAVTYSSDKRIRGIGLGWTWERRDAFAGGGYFASTGNLYFGNLSIGDTQTRQFDSSATGLGTEGRFTKATLQVSRLQSMFERHALYVSLGGQWASKNLDASEKLALGGARAVRAYPSGEALVDQGVIGTVEWRWSATGTLTPFVFYDAATGRINKSPLPRSPGDTDGNQRSLRGYGLGINWAQPGNFSINATLAWRDGTPRARTDGGGRNPRLYVQLQKVF